MRIFTGHPLFFIAFIVVFLCFLPCSVEADDPKTPPLKDGPVPVNVLLNLNRIYDINTVEQHYRIDGYLVLNWIDERLKSLHVLATDQMYENENATQYINNEIWFPTFEFINVLEKEQVQNKYLIVKPDGHVTYVERFNGQFYAEMDFRKFPFDKQKFTLAIESFSYEKNELIFVDLKIYPKIEEADVLLKKWHVIDIGTNISDSDYDISFGHHDGESLFSRASFNISASRRSGYYIWQVMLPLMLIIVASWVVFWIEKVGDQLGIAFTLMLTVVAFNFYTGTMLPKLPYNTFIESLIIAGYIFIFGSIVAIAISHKMLGLKHLDEAIRMNDKFRVIFPILYLITLSYLYWDYFGF